MKFYLVRHGETDWNRLGRFQGQSDTALNARGLAQAEDTARAAREWNLTAIYSSPLARTMQVAEAVSQQTGLPVAVRAGLKEMALGELEGIQGEAMRVGWPEVYHTWRDYPAEIVMPGGESLAGLQERVWEVVRELEQAHSPEDNIAVISHNFAIRAICGWLLGMPLSNFHRMHLSLGSVSLFDSGPRGRRLLYYNATGHLTPGNRSD